MLYYPLPKIAAKSFCFFYPVILTGIKCPVNINELFLFSSALDFSK